MQVIQNHVKTAVRPNYLLRKITKKNNHKDITKLIIPYFNKCGKIRQPKTHLAPYIHHTGRGKIRIDDMVCEISSSFLKE